MTLLAASTLPEGVRGRIALYSDSFDEPFNLVAQTDVVDLVPGQNVIPMQSEVAVAARDYWIVFNLSFSGDSVPLRRSIERGARMFYRAGVAVTDSLPASINSPDYSDDTYFTSVSAVVQP